MQVSNKLFLLTHKIRQPKWWITKSIRFAMYLLLLDLAFVFLYLLIYILVQSIKSPQDLVDMSVKWIPNTFHFENYVHAYNNLKFSLTFTNSMFVTVCATLGHLLGCSFTAYGFARFKFPFKNILFIVLILSIIVPVQTILVPIYLLYSLFGFVGSPIYLGITLPTLLGFGLKGGLFVFIFYSYFLSLPKSIEEAAYIDGCGSLKTFSKIIVPTATPAYLICGVLSFVWHWADYYEPSLYITSAKRFLLPQMLPMLYDLENQYNNAITPSMIAVKDHYNDAVMMAATAITVLPVLIAYIFVQHRFIESIATTGIKE